MDDREAGWRAWVGPLAEALVLFARQWTATHAEAEEAVQEGIFRCWKKGVEPGPESAHLLFRWVKWAARDMRRGERRRRRREAAAARPMAVDPIFEVPEDQRQECLVVQQALEALPPEQREVVTLKVWGELTYFQIAEVLGISPGTAGTRHRLGLKGIRQWFEERGEGPWTDGKGVWSRG